MADTRPAEPMERVYLWQPPGSTSWFLADEDWLAKERPGQSGAVVREFVSISALLAERQTREAAERDCEGFRSKLAETIGKLIVADASLAKANARIAELEAAMTVIRLRDWSWKGGSSDVRVAGEFGSLAASAMRLAPSLPDGWPTEAEYTELRDALGALSSINKEPSHGDD